MKGLWNPPSPVNIMAFLNSSFYRKSIDSSTTHSKITGFEYPILFAVAVGFGAVAVSEPVLYSTTNQEAEENHTISWKYLVAVWR